MSQTKTVRLDEEVMNTLAEKRDGFETPNECLKRILNSLENCSNQHNEKCSEEPEDNES